jgi:hypothetical protein
MLTFLVLLVLTVAAVLSPVPGDEVVIALIDLLYLLASD